MNHGGAGKIVEAGSEGRQEMAVGTHKREEAVGPPGPVSNDGINKSGDGDAVEQIADEAGASDHGARGDGGAGVGESELKQPEGEKGDAGGFIGCRDALEEEPMVSDETVAMAKHEGEAKGIEEDAAEAGVNDAFHEDVDGFAGAAEPGFEHGEADLHSEDKKSRDERPNGVDGIDHVGGFDFSIGGVDDGEEHSRGDGDEQEHDGDAHGFASQHGPAVTAPLGF